MNIQAVITNKRIVLGFAMIVFIAAVVAAGTGAFFSDTESSTGNTFTAGSIDLQIDNDSYVTNNEGELVHSSSTSWEISDLTDQLFFDFHDLKPGDVGEDTISIHVDDNDAWACMAANITGTPENGQTEPEAVVDASAGENEGELQDELYFAFWADDGDNVYESDEEIIIEGTAAEVLDGTPWTLADSNNNIWTASSSDPLPGASTRYIAKAWCYGGLGEDPVAQDNESGSGPLDRGTGFTCDGAGVTNASQSDGIVADVSFYAVQSRNNDDFTCSTWTPPTGGGDDTEIETETGEGWSPEATGTLNEDRWLAKARYGQNNASGAYELEVGFGPGLRSEENHVYTDNVGETFTLDYDDTTKIATVTVGSDSTSYTVSGTPTSIGITAKGSASNGVTKLTGATFNGTSIPDTVATTDGHEWTSISGADVSGDFVLTGTLTLDWDSPVDENPTLQVDVLY